MRHKAFGVIAKVNVKQAVNGNLAKILLGFLGFKPIGLILGHILSQGSGIAPQLRHGFPGIRVLLPMITVQRMRKSLIQYWHFPVFQLPSQLFSIGAEQAPTLFIAAMYQGEQVGNFALAMAAITLPVSLVAKTLSKSFYAGIADLGRHQVREAMDIGLYILKRIILVTVLIGVVTFLLAGQLIPLVFGTQWGLAGAIVEQMVPYLIGVIVFTSVSGILDVFHRQDLRLRLDIQRFILVITLLFWASKTNMAFIDFIKAYSVTLLIHFLISTVSVFLCLRNLRNAGSTDNFPA
jgi:O-antigen/teichoic acid export membrane protein